MWCGCNNLRFANCQWSSRVLRTTLRPEFQLRVPEPDRVLAGQHGPVGTLPAVDRPSRWRGRRGGLDHRNRLDRRIVAAAMDRPVGRPVRGPHHLAVWLRHFRDRFTLEPLDPRPRTSHLHLPRPAGRRIRGDLLEQPDLRHPPGSGWSPGRGDRNTGGRSIHGNRYWPLAGRIGPEHITNAG